MATIEVSTWAQLASAITSAANNDTIKLIADIDCNDEIPEGVTSTISLPIGINATIDGSYEEDNVIKNHEIRNLRTSVNSPVSIFKISRSGNSAITHTIKNIDFVNLILNKPLLDVEDYYTAIHTFNIRNCRFTGKRYDYLIKRLAGQSSGAQGFVNVQIYNSYFNVPYYGTSSAKASLCAYYSSGDSYFRSYMYNCRIRESFNNTYTPSTLSNTVCCGVSNTALSGCRVEGEIVNGYDARYHTDAVLNLLTPSIQNVYDVDFALSDNGGTDTQLYAFKGVCKIPVHKKDDTSYTYEISSHSTGTILATESQMKDTEWLIQQGFDVVPSNT